MTELTAQQRAEIRAAAEWLVADFEAAKPMVYGSEARTELPAANVIALLDLCDRLEKQSEQSIEQIGLLRKEALYAELQLVMSMHNDTLAALAAEREHASALAAALEPFARWAKDYSEEDDDEGFEIDPLLSMDDRAASASDLRRAASVLDAHRAREGGGG